MKEPKVGEKSPKVELSPYYTKYIVVSSEGNGRPSYRLNKLEGDQETQDYKWDEGNKLVTYSFVQNRMSKLLGQVLTVIDAAIPESEKRQSKAVKDLVKTIFVDEYVELTDMLHDKDSLMQSCNNVPLKDIEGVSEDEALGIK